jgi:hypothetical protein
MMKVKLGGLLFVLVILATSQPALGYDISLGDNVKVLIKGELTYTLKARVEPADKELVNLSAGNRNFEDAWDLANNKLVGKVEIEATGYDYYTFFVRAEAFYDFVYMDYEDYFDNDYFKSEDVAEARRYNEYYIEALEYYLEGNYGKLAFRLGRQVVQWGQSLAPAYAPGVNIVSPFYGAKIAVAGYTYRDYQYPTLMAMARYRLIDTVEIEGVYSPDFSPDDYMSPAGSFYSFTDTLGYGNSGVLNDRAPKSFSDMQQYGGVVRTVWRGLNNLELGFYYYHYLDRAPSVDNDVNWTTLLTGLATGDENTLLDALGLYGEYPEIDMLGLGFSTAIDWLDMNIQINGDIAYRPNDTIGVKSDYLYINNDTPEAAAFANAVAASVGVPLETLLGMPIEDLGELPQGYDEGGTLNWVLGGMRIFSDVLSFTPYTFSSSPIFEFYGQHIMDYDEDKYSDLENTAFYYISVPFSTADMIDNTTLTLNVDASGVLHYENRSLHRFAFSVKARYGDNLQALLGYDFVIGILSEELGSPIGGSWKSDRDALTLSLTYFFI